MIQNNKDLSSKMMIKQIYNKNGIFFAKKAMTFVFYIAVKKGVSC